jgi:hypothetical protein
MTAVDNQEDHMKALKLGLSIVLLVTVAGLASAAGFEKGSNLFAVQLTEGVADLVQPVNGAGYVTAWAHSELGGQVQFWHFFSEEYALTVAGGIGYFGETDKPGTTAGTGAKATKYTQNSWQVRLGGDRVAKINDRIHLFVGPGIQVWSGESKFVSGVSRDQDWKSKAAMRIAAEGRVGFHLAYNDKVGMTCQLGHYFGYASSTADKGAKATWWPSGHDGAVGIAFKF